MKITMRHQFYHIAQSSKIYSHPKTRTPFAWHKQKRLMQANSFELFCTNQKFEDIRLATSNERKLLVASWIAADATSHLANGQVLTPDLVIYSCGMRLTRHLDLHLVNLHIVKWIRLNFMWITDKMGQILFVCFVSFVIIIRYK